ncbi:MAG: hypothetical protein ACPHJ1_04015 [Ilumatobacteraceae bacterium]|jgi:hypothetical protein
MATIRCLGCGGEIELVAGRASDGVIAAGDRFMHEGCVIDSRAVARRVEAGVPAYRIPEGW